MTEPRLSRPVPGPPRPGPAAGHPEHGTPAEPDRAGVRAADGDGAAPAAAADRFADLERRPVSEHVAVYEAEHARLQVELSTIDEL